MAEKVNITIQVDAELKKQAEQLFSELGMNMSTAFNFFLYEAVRQQRIPFDYADIIPNAETIEAMEEAECISRDPTVTGYTDVAQMLDEILSDSGCKK